MSLLPFIFNDKNSNKLEKVKYRSAPKKYKCLVVSGMIHRIIRACSCWETVHKSIIKAKKILQDNQYPPSFYDPIIKNTLHSIFDNKEKPESEDTEKEKEEDHKMLLIQRKSVWKGRKVTEENRGTL